MHKIMEATHGLVECAEEALEYFSKLDGSAIAKYSEHLEDLSVVLLNCAQIKMAHKSHSAPHSDSKMMLEYREDAHPHITPVAPTASHNPKY